MQRGLETLRDSAVRNRNLAAAMGFGELFEVGERWRGCRSVRLARGRPRWIWSIAIDDGGCHASHRDSGGVALSHRSPAKVFCRIQIGSHDWNSRFYNMHMKIDRNIFSFDQL